MQKNTVRLYSPNSYMHHTSHSSVTHVLDPLQKEEQRLGFIDSAIKCWKLIICIQVLSFSDIWHALPVL